VDHDPAKTVRSVALLTLSGAIATAWLLAACTGDPRIDPRRQPTAGTVSFTPDAGHVKDLCDFFAYRAVDTLGTPEAEGNVSLLAERPGVPGELADTARSFYADGIVRPDTTDHRTTLELRYTTMLRACRDAGTGWTRP